MKAAILVAPGTVLADLAPAHAMLSMIPSAEVHTVWKKKEILSAFPGTFPFLPTTTFAECPRQLDVLLVPAVGPEVHADDETLDFLAERGAEARFVTSVCAGALMLGAAGLLNGYRTATHWMLDEMLPQFGAIITTERVVVDRNRITSDGGSAATEHTIVLAKHLVGDDYAQEIELFFEWDPQPQLVFGTGTPTKAGPELTNRLLTKMAPEFAGFAPALAKAVERLQAQGLLEDRAALARS
jgi:transcriptional regulator GlxA family with amidase domain